MGYCAKCGSALAKSMTDDEVIDGVAGALDELEKIQDTDFAKALRLDDDGDFGTVDDDPAGLDDLNDLGDEGFAKSFGDEGDEVMVDAAPILMRVGDEIDQIKATLVKSQRANEVLAGMVKSLAGAMKSSLTLAKSMGETLGAIGNQPEPRKSILGVLHKATTPSGEPEPANYEEVLAKANAKVAAGELDAHVLSQIDSMKNLGMPVPATLCKAVGL